VAEEEEEEEDVVVVRQQLSRDPPRHSPGFAPSSCDLTSGSVRGRSSGALRPAARCQGRSALFGSWSWRRLGASQLPGGLSSAEPRLRTVRLSFLRQRRTQLP
jgi:hypothetical protein